MMKRFLSLLLALCLTLALLPGVLPQAEAATVSFRQANSAARAALPFTAEEFEVIRLTNKERMAEGLHPVTTFAKLQNACDIRAVELVDLFSHTRPDGSDCWTAMEEAGVDYHGAAENIAAGYVDPRAVVTGWMNSNGHRANILNENLDHMGAGYYYLYGAPHRWHWVQMFTRYNGEEYTGATVYVPEGEEVGTGIDDMYMYAVLYSNVYGDCYLPISSEFVTGFDPNRSGAQTIGLKFLGFSGTLTITLSGEPVAPAAPEIKISANTDTGKPKLTWEAVDGADVYRIYRATSKSGKYSYYKSTRSTGFTDTAAEVGTNYYYKVRALNEEYDLLSGYSNTVNRVCDLAKPVVSIKLTDGGDPRLTWDKIEGTAKYYVYRATSKDGEYTKVKTTVTASSFTDSTAEAGTKYYYKVKAIHAKESANSAYSSVKYITAK